MISLPLCVVSQPSRQRTNLVCVDVDKSNWPPVADVCCWHCCHKFDTVPVPLPVGYNGHKDLFTVQGMFCSWGCAKAHLMDHFHHSVGQLSTFLTLLHKRTVGKVKHITRAPPRVALQMFGGPLSIEEFRNISGSCSIHPAPKNMVVISPNLIESDMEIDKPQTYKEVNFQGVQTNNEPLRLKRNKPLKNSKHTLEKAMGLAIGS